VEFPDHVRNRTCVAGGLRELIPDAEPAVGCLSIFWPPISISTPADEGVADVVNPAPGVNASGVLDVDRREVALAMRLMRSPLRDRR
jgi:hypothetical protein